MSGVRCQVSGVTCQVSRVRLHMIFIFLFYFFSQSGEASRLRVCYQQGLSRLVFCIGATIPTRQEIQCLPYMGFLVIDVGYTLT